VATLLFYGLIAVAVAAAIVALLIVFLPPGRMIAPVVVADVIPDGLPATGQLVADDVARIRLPVALRGYRMTEVDAVLDRLAVELELRDRRLAELTGPSELTRPAAPAPSEASEKLGE
jgi:DivIVA domain-containing protein